MRAEALIETECGDEPCPSGYLRVRVYDDDPLSEDTLIPIDLEEETSLRRVGEDSSLMGEEYLWVGYLGDIPAGSQSIVVSAEPTTQWTLTFEDFAGPTPHVDPAGARGETFTVSGTGPGRRELRLAEGTWTMLMEVSNNVLNCEEPDDQCTVKLLLIVLQGAGGPLQAFFEATRHFSESFQLRVANDGSAYHPMGTLHLALDVAPIAEWTVTFVAPGDPIPTPAPTPGS